MNNETNIEIEPNREIFSRPPEFILMVLKPLGVLFEKQIKERLEKYGIIKHCRLLEITSEMASKHYSEHHELSVYSSLVKYLCQEGKGQKQKLPVFILEEDITKRSPYEKRPFAQRIKEDIIGPTRPKNIPDAQKDEFIRGMVESLPYQIIIEEPPIPKTPPIDVDNLKFTKEPPIKRSEEKFIMRSEQKARSEEDNLISQITENAEKGARVIIDNLIHSSSSEESAWEEIINLYKDYQDVVDEYTRKLEELKKFEQKR